MKKILPLLAVLAATTATAMPAAAQDVSSFLNPQALAAQMGLQAPTGARIASPVVVDRSALTALSAPRVVVAEPSLIAPRSSLRPVSRPDVAALLATDAPQLRVEGATVLEIETPAPSMADMENLLDQAVAAAPTGANTAVIITDAPARPTFWQRLFSR